MLFSRKESRRAIWDYGSQKYSSGALPPPTQPSPSEENPVGKRSTFCVGRCFAHPRSRQIPSRRAATVGSIAKYPRCTLGLSQGCPACDV
eukprot:507214-Amorphochlora_amoeboformis.AAC.2